MILIYDLRRDIARQKNILWEVQEQWNEYLTGAFPVEIHEGIIERFFYAAYEGEHMFVLDEGNRKTSWIKMGDESWYAIGRTAKIEEASFHLPPPFGKMPVITRIWIGDETSDDPKQQ